MDRYEISAALLSVPVPLAVHDPRRVARSLNEAAVEAVWKAPERFGLLATLPLPDVDGALAEVAYAFDALRADGILLLSDYEGVYLGDPRFEPIFAELDRRNAVVFVHPAVSRSPIPTIEPSLFEFVFDTTRAVANLVISGTLERHPNIRLIAAHAGGTVPYVHDRVGRQLQRLFYDVALSANETVLSCLRRLVPSSHILLGTDFPFAREIGITSTLAGLGWHGTFAAADRRAIDGDNALRLFPRLAGADQPGAAAARREAESPADEHQQAVLEADQVPEVDHQPGHPRQQAA
jgi:6-methylsalicylate decarboxylase